MHNQPTGYTQMSTATPLPPPLTDLVIEYAIGGTRHFLQVHIRASYVAVHRVRSLRRARDFLQCFHPPRYATLRQVVTELNVGGFWYYPTRGFRECIDLTIILDSHHPPSAR
jgi:hypothetical protein